jgi:hypothetical protein
LHVSSTDPPDEILFSVMMPALMRAETALELKTRRADDDLLAAQRALESRVDTEVQ